MNETPQQPDEMMTVKPVSFDNLITIEVAAGLIRRRPQTLKNWIYQSRKLNGTNGLVDMAGKKMIDKPLFEASFLKRPA